MSQLTLCKNQFSFKSVGVRIFLCWFDMEWLMCVTVATSDFVLILFPMNRSHAPKIKKIFFYVPADGHEQTNVYSDDQSTNAIHTA